MIQFLEKFSSAYLEYPLYLTLCKDECQESKCDSNAVCEDEIGSFTCACKDGFIGNGTECTDINECKTHECHSNAKCYNIPGYFNCTCDSGYSDDGVKCSDIDECFENLDDCAFNANCSNIEGGFACKCRSGYSDKVLT